MYGSALAGYSRAAELDPGWKEPPEREKQLLEYLEKVTELLQNKVGDSLQKYRHTVYVLLQKRTEKKSVKIMLWFGRAKSLQGGLSATTGFNIINDMLML